MSNAVATPPKEPVKSEPVKADPKPLLKETHQDWIAHKAVDKCFEFGRQSPRYGKKRDEPHLLHVYIGFWKNNIVSEPIFKPSLPPLEAIVLADCTLHFNNGVLLDVTCHRVITREDYDREEKAAREARRA